MLVAKEIVQGSYNPFKVFSKRGEMAIIHDFMNYILHSDNDVENMNGVERFMAISSLFKDFNAATYRRLQRIIKRYDISHVDFIQITCGFFDCVREERELIFLN